MPLSTRALTRSGSTLLGCRVASLSSLAYPRAHRATRAAACASSSPSTDRSSFTMDSTSHVRCSVSTRHCPRRTADLRCVSRIARPQTLALRSMPRFARYLGRSSVAQSSSYLERFRLARSTCAEWEAPAASLCQRSGRSRWRQVLGACLKTECSYVRCRPFQRREASTYSSP